MFVAIAQCRVLALLWLKATTMGGSKNEAKDMVSESEVA